MSDKKGIDIENVIGPDYNYTDYVRTPDELGVNSGGSINQIKTNYKAMGEYFKLMLSGTSKASKEGSQFRFTNSEGRILGPSFFIDTFAKCKDAATGAKVQRSLYYNFKPTGDIIIANAGSDLRGLFPGILSNVDMLNPITMLEAIEQGDTPTCHKIRMPVFPTKDNGNRTTQVRYVTEEDIKTINECAFVLDNRRYPSVLGSNKANGGSGINPITNKICKKPYVQENREAFSNYKIPKDYLVEMYIGALSVLLLLLLLNIYKKYN